MFLSRGKRKKDRKFDGLRKSASGGRLNDKFSQKQTYLPCRSLRETLSVINFCSQYIGSRTVSDMSVP